MRCGERYINKQCKILKGDKQVLNRLPDKIFTFSGIEIISFLFFYFCKRFVHFVQLDIHRLLLFSFSKFDKINKFWKYLTK